MFDLIRVANEREFYLMLGMQELGKDLWRNQKILSDRQTQSRKVYALLVLFLIVCLFVFACYFMVKFLILKKKFIPLNL